MKFIERNNTIFNTDNISLIDTTESIEFYYVRLTFIDRTQHSIKHTDKLARDNTYVFIRDHLIPIQRL